LSSSTSSSTPPEACSTGSRTSSPAGCGRSHSRSRPARPWRARQALPPRCAEARWRAHVRSACSWCLLHPPPATIVLLATDRTSPVRRVRFALPASCGCRVSPLAWVWYRGACGAAVGSPSHAAPGEELVPPRAGRGSAPRRRDGASAGVDQPALGEDGAEERPHAEPHRWIGIRINSHRRHEDRRSPSSSHPRKGAHA
jgi:hypothetical protein